MSIYLLQKNLRLWGVLSVIIFSLGITMTAHAQNADEQASEGASEEIEMRAEPQVITEGAPAIVQGFVEVTSAEDDATFDLMVSGKKSGNVTAVSGSGQAAFASVDFFGVVPEAFEEEFAKNKDITTLCKKRDNSEDLDQWCDGSERVTVEVDADSAVQVPFIVRLPQEAKDAEVFIVRVASDEEAGSSEIIDAINLTYTAPEEKIFAADIAELKAKRAFGIYNFLRWIGNGTRDAYDIDVIVENTGTEDVTYTVEILREKDGEESVVASAENVIMPEKKTSESFPSIVVPRIGTVSFFARLTYETPDGSESIVTDKAVLSFLPIKEIISAALLVISALAVWRWLAVRKRKMAQDHGYSPEESYVEESPQMQAYKQKSKRSEGDGNTSVAQMQSQQLHAVGENRAMVQSRQVPRVQGVQHVEQPIVREQKRYEATISQEVQQNHGQPMNQERVQSRPNAAMDLDWMREDEGVFSDAMQSQERSTNMRVGAFVIVLLGLCGVVAAIAISKSAFFQPKPETISIEDATKGVADDQQIEDAEEKGEDTPKVSDEKKEEQVPEPEPETAKEEVVEKKASTDVSPETLTVQVLNGGSRAGYAGQITEAVAAKKYKTKSPQNASNTHTAVTIYHREGAQATAQALAGNVPELKKIVFEESEAVVERYSADLVLVLSE